MMVEKLAERSGGLKVGKWVRKLVDWKVVKRDDWKVGWKEMMLEMK